jgi:A nuclease family of the HNH/ENDO VII superfamily with conserved AHH/Novel toxin 10
MGIDPVGVDENNVHSHNRYAYANNNPYKFVDPDGRVAETVWDVANVAMDVASLGANLTAGNYGGAAVDFVGLIVDAAATVVPVVPGGAGAGIKAYRGSQLAKNMDNAGNGVVKGAEEAHHIVAQSAKKADKAREILKKHNIDIHSAENGAAMSKSSHRGTHTDKYYDGLNSRLRDANSGSNAGDNVRGVLKEYQKNLQGK